MPPIGLNVGVETLEGWGSDGSEVVIVYIAVAVSLPVIPSLKALALSVVVRVTGIGPEYSVEEDTGSAPLVV